DGRVRVTDFGLVAATGDASTPSPVTAGGEVARLHGDAERGDVLATPLTRTGMVLGTPPYMAPEAHSGGVSDALGDQWSLCVAWWEALAGVRPFAGATYRELVRSICDGAITRGRDAVPPSIARVLERGLSVERAARYPSIPALVAALDAADDELANDARARAAAEGVDVAAPTVAIPSSARNRVVLGLVAVGGLAGAVRFLAFPSRTAPARQPVATSAAPPRAPAPPPTPERLTTPGGCPYMPIAVDGGATVYDDGLGDIWHIDRPGAAPRKIVGDPAMDWRVTRGRRAGEILYTAPASDGSSVVALDLATGAQERLPVLAFAYAFGGGAILYARTDVSEIRRLDASEDTVIARLPESFMGYSIAATPDGRWLAITTAADRAESTLCLLELEPGTGRTRRPLECLDRHDVLSGRAALAPDGSAVYYQTVSGIRRRTLSDGATAADTLWLPGAYAYGGLDISPDGTRLVYSDSNPDDVAVFEPHAPDRPLLRGKIFAPDVTADGRWYYIRHTAGGDELVEQTPDGKVRLLVSGLGPLRGPFVSPDGEMLSFEAHGAEPGIWVVDTGPHPPLRLTTRNGDISPVWTRDGLIAFTRFDEHKQPFIHVIDPALGTDGDDARTPIHRRPRITMSRNRATGEIVVQSLDALHVYQWDPATGKERRVDLGSLEGKSVGGYPSFDGTWMAAIGMGSVHRVSLDRTPATVEALYTATGCNTFDHPLTDGQGRLLVVERRWRGDVYSVPLTAPDAPAPATR
ncbi:MAG TPA: hypothetical protein VM261_11730, partial [Kofleriaceae bacterium]|nr:hypothetical protein [Kofleriaceae bacterium]